MQSLSIVVPCYNEEGSLPLYYGAMQEVLAALPLQEIEFIFVNDGSSDGTLPILRDLAQKDARVKYISLSRNFGKEAAIYAGLEHASLALVAVMDADGQDPAFMLPQMLEMLEQTGCDCVAARRTTRQGEPPIRSFFARMFYKLINRISSTPIVDGARDFRLMRRPMVEAILSVREYNRFSKGIFSWVGFDTRWVEYINVERVAGETKWSFWKLFLYSLDGIIAFTTAPLAVSSFAGFFFCVVAFVMLLFVVIRALLFGDPVSGWPSLVSIMLLIAGIQLFSIGVLGQYMAKTYLETKARPIYITKETNIENKDG